MKGPSFLILVVLGFLMLLSYSRPIVFSATLRSPQEAGFILETNVTIPPPTPTPFKPIIQTGFTESTSSKPLRLTVSSDLIDFGPLSPTNPIKRLLTISIELGSSQGYSLLSFENHPLKAADGPTIPDTTCDDGACNEQLASPWINPFTFGLGYSFDDRMYQQFADQAAQETPVKIVPGEITIKLNVGKNNLGTHYENTIIFLAIPNY